MHPINYKSSGINSSLQMYFQILWVTNQFSDVNIFYEMPIGLWTLDWILKIILLEREMVIHLGIYFFHLRAHVCPNKKDKLNKILLINVLVFLCIGLLKKILSFDSIPVNKVNIYSLTPWSLHFLESGETKQIAQYFKFWVVPCSSWVIRST